MFRLPKDAETWFADIRKDMSFDFDVYYFCLMAGLAKGEKETLPTSETKDITPRFPQEYRAESKIIMSLFLKKELDKMGVSLDDRKAVHETIKKYIDSTDLSEDGQKEINRYVNGGIQVIKEYFGDRPRTIEVFLLRFSQMIDSLCSIDQEVQ